MMANPVPPRRCKWCGDLWPESEPLCPGCEADRQPNTPAYDPKKVTTDTVTWSGGNTDYIIYE